jgi:hypothetical protein
MTSKQIIEQSRILYFSGQIGAAIRLLEEHGRNDTDILYQRIRLLISNVFLNNQDVSGILPLIGDALKETSDKQQDDFRDQLGLALYYLQITKDQPDFSESTQLFTQVMDNREDRSDQAGLVDSCFHLGLVHQYSGERKSAIEYFNSSALLASRLGLELESVNWHAKLTHFGG